MDSQTQFLAPMTFFSLQLPNHITSRLRDLANRTGHTEVHLATEAICQHIQDLEDLCIAEERMKELDSGEVRPLSLDDLIHEDDVNL